VPHVYSRTVQEFLGGTEEYNSKPESEEPRLKPVTSNATLQCAWSTTSCECDCTGVCGPENSVSGTADSLLPDVPPGSSRQTVMGPDFRATFHTYSFVPGRQTDGLLSYDEQQGASVLYQRRFPFFHNTRTCFHLSLDYLLSSYRPIFPPLRSS
jgi:hypothetical protein